MSDISDEALPTEQAVVNYINKRLGQNQDGISVGLSRLGAGTLMLDGSQSMEGDLDLDNNNIVNLGTLNTTNINATLTDTDNLTVNTTANIQSAKIAVLTDQRLVIAGALGVLEDSANLTFNGTSLTVDGNQTITGSLLVSGITTFSQMIVDNLTVEGEITTGPVNSSDIRIAGNKITTTSSNADLDLEVNGSGHIALLAPTDITGNVDITGTVDISSTLDVVGQTTLASVNVEDLTAARITFAGTSGELVDSANLTFASATDTLTLTGTQNVTGQLNVDNISLDGDTITLKGNRIYGSGSAALGNIYMIPGYTGVNLGTVEIFGNLSVTGTVNTTDVGLENTQINGNLTVFGNSTFGDLITDGVTFTARINSDMIPLTDSSWDRWRRRPCIQVGKCLRR